MQIVRSNKKIAPLRSAIPMKKIHSFHNLKHFKIQVPGSKSYANRALILAALADGKSILKNVPFCDDSLALIQALKTLGIRIEQKKPI